MSHVDHCTANIADIDFETNIYCCSPPFDHYLLLSVPGLNEREYSTISKTFSLQIFVHIQKRLKVIKMLGNLFLGFGGRDGIVSEFFELSSIPF